MLMPPLIQKWNVLKDEDKDLFPLLEVRHNFNLFHQCLEGGLGCHGFKDTYEMSFKDNLFNLIEFSLNTNENR